MPILFNITPEVAPLVTAGAVRFVKSTFQLLQTNTTERISPCTCFHAFKHTQTWQKTLC